MTIGIRGITKQNVLEKFLRAPTIGERLRKLSEKELNKYRGEFWKASSRLKVYDQEGI